MSKVRGENCLLYFNDGGVWKLGACARTITLDVTTEVVETTVTGNGKWASFAPTKNSFTASLDGVVSLNNTGMLGLPDFRQKQINQEIQYLRYQRTDNDGNLYTDECYAWITNTNDIGAFDNVAVYSMQMQGSGMLTLTFTPIVPVPVGGVLVYRYEYTATGGEYGFTYSGLIGKTILEVNIDGDGSGKILLSGTPVGNDVKFVSTTGQIVTAIPFESGEEIYILYQ